ncbi:MAG: 2-oxoglutarate oxidoreductase [Bacteroidales bacterium]|nr:2-oxoglutarate oxidoreductase [Bacteroidales bacterium]
METVIEKTNVNVDIEALRKEIIKEENIVFKKTIGLTDNPLSYCPGCGHGVVHRLIGEVCEEMEIIQDVIAIAPVGCSVFAYDFFNLDTQSAAHGRAPAVATGVKRTMPDKYVFTYQGDGDLAAIGTGETIHAANRGENITIIFINNGIYGMTGGQMAPTTLLNMKSSTSPYGREMDVHGYPLNITDMIAPLRGVCYATRQSVHTPANVRKAKAAIKKAFEYQKLKKGLSIVEIMSNCNSGWKMTPVQSNKWMEENMLENFPLGDIKVPQDK